MVVVHVNLWRGIIIHIQGCVPSQLSSLIWWLERTHDVLLLLDNVVHSRSHFFVQIVLRGDIYEPDKK